MEAIRATLRLFNSIQVDQLDYSLIIDPFERTLENGYIIDPNIPITEEILTIVEDTIGLSGEKANASFHKSWRVVRDKSMETLVLQQIIHYISTYGFERLGIYSQDTVYIPHEELNIPDICEDIPLVIIRPITSQKLLEQIISLGSGIALAQETLGDIMTIIKANDYNSNFIKEIGNRELKMLLYDFYDIAPVEPVEFLRYLIIKLTGESLLIKNDALIEKIKTGDGSVLDTLLEKTPDNLASIFLRFKPLFLAMKSISGNKTFFNRLRKQAVKMHQSLPEDYFNSITEQIKTHRLNLVELKWRLEQQKNIFRKIRLAYALNHRLHSDGSIVYRVRNGRGWATEFEWENSLQKITQQTLDIVINSIINDVQDNVEGMTIYIPTYIHYALPATEKQFTGHFPTGSYVTVPEDMIVGIHWVNMDKRVDLDLSVVSEEGKVGWDSYYRSEELDVLFSGDMTDAPPPDGASELFYLKKQVTPRIMFVNYFNHESGNEVKTRILVAQDAPNQFDQNYMIDVNKVVASATINITQRQNILGLLTSADNENRFYFANINIGNSITSQWGKQSDHTRKYLINSLVGALELVDILKAAGAKVIDRKPDNGEYLDLSPEALNKSAIIDLIEG